MGALQQLGLILWKNLILRKRKPVILFLELIWPVILFVVVALIRLSSPPVDSHECHYSPRSMPSAGGYEFIQSFACNLDNKCYADEESAQKKRSNPQTEAFLQQAAPVFADVPRTTAMLNSLPQATATLNKLQNMLTEPEIQQALNLNLTLGSLLKNQTEARAKLTQYLEVGVVDALFSSAINITMLFELSADLDLAEILCDPAELGSYLLLTPDTMVTMEQLSQQLCDLDEEKIPDIVDVIQEQLDIVTIIDMIASLKSAVGSYDDAALLEDISSMVAIVQNSNLVAAILDRDNMASIQETAEWIFQVVKFVQGLMGDGQFSSQSFRRMIDKLNPLMSALTDDAPWWPQLKTSLEPLYGVFEWIQNLSPDLSELNVTVDDLHAVTYGLLRMDLIVKDFPSAIVDALLKTSVDIDKTKALVDAMLTPDADIRYLACVDPGLMSMLKPGNHSNMTTADLGDIQKHVCEQLDNSTDIIKQYAKLFVDYINAFRDEEAMRRLEDYDWSTLLNVSHGLLDNLGELSDWLGPLLSDGPVSLQGLWDTVTETLTGIGNMTNINFLQNLGLDYLPYLNMLSSQFIEDSTSRMITVVTSHLVDIAYWATDNIQNLDNKLKQILQASPKAREFFSRVTILEEAEINSVMHIILNQSQVILNDSEKFFSHAACNASFIREFMGSNVMNSDLAVTRIQTVLCDPDMTSVLKQIAGTVNTTELTEQLMLLEGLLDGSVNTSSPQFDAHANMTSIQVRIVQLVELNSQLYGEYSFDDWFSIQSTLDAEGLEFDLMDWINFVSSATTVSANFMAHASVITLGPAFEKSMFGPMFLPYIKSIESSPQSAFDLIINAMTDKSTLTGRLYDLAVRALPDVMDALTVTLRRPQVALSVASSLATMCESPDAALHILLKTDAMLGLRELICNVTADPSSVQAPEWSNLISSFEADMDSPVDWDRLYWGIVRGTNTAVGTNWTRLEIWDANRYAASTRQLMEAAQETTVSHLLQMILYSMAPVLQSADTIMARALPGDLGWSKFEKGVAAFNDLLVLQTQEANRSAVEGIRLDALVGDSPVLINLTRASAQRIPELLEALQSALLQPSKMFNMLLTVDLSEKQFCRDISILDFVTFPNVSAAKVAEYEQMLCALNFTAVWQEALETPSMKNYSQAIEKLLTLDSPYADNSSPTEVDWTAVVTNLNSMLNYTVQASMNNASFNPLLADLGLDPADLERALEQLGAQLQGMDLNDLAVLYQQVMDFNDILELFIDDPTANEVSMVMYNTLAVSDAFYIFMNNQLSRMIGANLSLSSLLPSEELQKMLTTSQLSQEATQVVLNGIISLVTTPGKLAELIESNGQDFLRLCNDTAVFSKYFPIASNSSVDGARLQASVCGTSQVNVEKLWTELQSNMAGLAEYVDIMTRAFTGEALPLNLTSFVKNIEQYMALIEALTMNPPTIQMSELSPWLKETDWAGVVQMLVQQLETAYSQENNFGIDLSSLDLFIAGNTDIINAMNAYVEALNKDLSSYTNSSINLDNLARGAPELSKVLVLLRRLPVVLEVLLASGSGSGADRLTPIFTDPRAVCNPGITLDTFFTIPEPRREEFSAAVMQYCDINTNSLGSELAQRFQFLGLVMTTENATYKPVNFETFNNNIIRLSDILTNLALQSSWTEDYSWLLNYNWAAILDGVNQQIMNQSIEDSLKDVSSILPIALSSLATDPSFMKALPQINAVVEALAKEITPFVGKNVTLNDLVSGAPETQKLVGYVKKLPAIYEVLVVTSVRRSDKLNPVWSSPSPLEFLCSKVTTLDDLFEIPASARQDFTEAVQGICSINYDTVTAELMAKYSNLAAVLATNATFAPVDLAAFGQNVMTLNELFTQLISQSKWTEDYSWLMNYNWGAVLESVNQQYMNQSIESVLKDLGDVLPRAVGSMANDPTFLQSLAQYNAIVQALVSEITPFVGKNVTLNDLVSGAPETQKLVGYVKKLPAIYEVLVVTSVRRSDKLNPLWSSPSPLEFLCSKVTTLDDLFEIPASARQDFTEAVQGICSINYDTVAAELMAKYSNLAAVLATNATFAPVDLTTFSQNIMTLTDLFTQLVTQSKWTEDYSWLMNYNWGAVLESVNQQYMNQSIESVLKDLGDVLPRAVGSMANDPMFLQSLAQYNAIVKALVTEIMPFVGKNVTLNDLVSGAPETQKLVGYVKKLPAIYEVLVMTSVRRSDKLNPLWSSPSPLEFLCSKVTTLDDLFEIPASARQDFTEAVQGICSINYDTVAAELMAKYSNLAAVLATLSIVQNATFAPVDLTTFSQNIMTLTDLFTQLVTQSKWTEDYSWLMNYNWAAVLESVNQQYMNQSIESVLKDLGDVLPRAVGSMANDPMFLQSLAQYNAIVQALVTEITPFVGKNVTLNDLVSGAPETQKLVGYVKKLPAIYEVLVLTSVRRSDKLNPLWSSPSPLEFLCSKVTTLDDLFEIPASARQDFTEAVQGICSINYDTVAAELMAKYSNLAAVLATNVTFAPVDLTTFSQNIMTLTDLFTQLVTQSKWTEDYSWLMNYNWAAVLESVNQQYMNQSIESVLKDLGDVLPRAVGSMANDPTFLQSLAQYNAIVQALVAEITPFVGKNVTLNDLVNGAPETQRLVAYVKKLPAIYEVLVLTSVRRSDKLNPLWSSPSPLEFLCSKVTTLDDLFEIPASARQDFTEAVQGICSINYDTVAAELMAKYSNLAAVLATNATFAPVDLTTFSQNIMTLTDLFTQLVTQSKWTEDYSWLMNYNWAAVLESVNQQYMNQSIESVIKDLGDVLPRALGPMANDPTFLKSLAQYNAIVQALSKEIRPFVGQNVSLSDLVSGAMETQRLLGYMRNLPAIYEVVLVTAVKQSNKLNPLWSSPSPLEFLCSKATSLDDLFEIPASARQGFTEAVQGICAINFDTVAAELMAKYPDLAKAFAPNTTFLVVDLETFSKNVMTLSDLLTQVATQSSWTEDYSWLTDFDWNRILGSLGDGSMDQEFWNSQLSQMLPLLDSLTMMGQNITALKTLDEILTAAAQALEVLAALRDPASVFSGLPTMQKLFAYQQNLANIVATLTLSSVHQSKFAPLQHMLSTNASAVCLMTDIKPYLTIPNTSANIDFNDLKRTICDFETLTKEFEVFSSRYYQPPAGDGKLNLTATYYRVLWAQQQLTPLINDGIVVPMELFPWLQMDTWDKAMASIEPLLAQSQDLNPMEGYTSYVELMTMIVSMFGQDPEVNKQAHVNQAIMATLSRFIDSLKNRTLTLPSLLPDSPELQKLLKLAEQMPEILGVLQASANTPEFQQLFAYDAMTALSMLCDPSKDPSHYLTKPQGVDVSLYQLRDRFCRVNFTVAEIEVMLSETLNINYIMQQSLNTAPVDWAAYTQTYQQLYQTVAQLTTNPPQFLMNTSFFSLEKWNTLASGFMQIAETGNTSTQAVDSIINIVKDSVVSVLTSSVPPPMFQQIGLIMTLTNQQLDILVDTNLTLQELAANATAFSRILQKITNFTSSLMNQNLTSGPYNSAAIEAEIDQMIKTYQILDARGYTSMEVDINSLLMALTQSDIYESLAELAQTSAGDQYSGSGLEVVTIILYYFNNIADLIQDEPYTLSSLVLDPSALRSLLATALDPNSVDLLLMAGLDPSTLLSSIDQKLFVSEVCDPESFQYIFSLPNTSTSDLTHLQQQICAAATNGTLLLQQIFGLVDVEFFVNRSLDFLNSEPNSLLEFTQQVDQMARNLQYLATPGSFDVSRLWPEWLQSVTEMLNDLDMDQINPDSYADVCNATVHWFERQYPGEVIPSLLMSHFYLNTSMLSLKALYEVEDVACHLPNMTVTEVLDTWNVSAARQLYELYKNALGGVYQSETFDCGAYITLINQYSSEVERLVVDVPATFTKVMTCLEDNQGRKVPVFTQVDSLLSLLSSSRDVLKDQGLTELLGPELVAVMDTVVTALVQQQPTLVSLEELWLNQTKLTQALSRVLELSPAIINQLLSVPIDINDISLVNMTDASLAALLCDPDTLSDILRLPPNMDVTMVTNAICGENLDTTVQLLKEGLNISNMVSIMLESSPEFGLSMDWLSNVLDNVNQLIIDAASAYQLTELFSDLDLAEQDIGLLLGRLQGFLQDNSPDKIFENIRAILLDLRKVLPPGEPQRYLDDLETLADGIAALNILNTHLPFDAKLSSLVKDPAVLKTFLVSKLSISQDVADALMDASLSYAKLADLDDRALEATICDPSELVTLLGFSGDVDPATVSDALCALNRREITEIFDYIIRELEIGEFIKSFVTIDPDMIMAKANVTQAEIDSIMANLTFSGSFDSVMMGFSDLTADLELFAISEALTDQQKGEAALTSFSQMLCGRDQAFSIDDSYGVGLRVKRSAHSHRVRRETPRKLSNYDRRQLAELQTKFCGDMYLTITGFENGAIMWAYLKPLLRGKILYSPATMATRAVMEEATKLFRDVDDLREMVQALGTNMKKLRADSNNRNFTSLTEALQNSFVSNALNLDIDLDELVQNLDSLRDLDLSSVDDVVLFSELAVDMIDCLESSRLEGYNRTEDLLVRAKKLAQEGNVLAGVHFTNMNTTMTKIPAHVSYELRLDIEHSPRTDVLQNNIYQPIPEDNFAEDMRYLRGFVQLQDMIDGAIIRLQTGNDTVRPEVSLQQFPFPCHRQDMFVLYISTFFFPILMTLAWLVAVGSAINSMVYDKERGLEETMKIMGLRSGVNWFGWFFNVYLGMLFVSLLLVIVLKVGNLFPYSDPIFLFVFMAVFSFSITMFCYMISTFFTKTTVASLSGVIIYLISYLPFVIFVAMNNSMVFWHRILLCLSATTAFSYGGQLIARYEQQGIGLQWDNADKEIGWLFPFTWCCYMMLIDAAIYGIIGWYIRNVFPGRYGVAQPWYFPVSPAYWGCAGCCRSASDSKYQLPKNGQANGLTDGPGEPDPTHLPIGISTHQLTKEYTKACSPARTVVDAVSMNLYRGQITAFLGQNGAGKTTTINMLTGYHRPSSGTAFLEGRDIRYDTTDIRKDLGLCPQQDVLFDFMTVREHLDMFVSLKGNLSRTQKKEEINRMLDQSGLRSCRHQRVSQISGGQKRRLCVAMAFIGGSKVIILDEPTSGVDPAARRAIWDLIIQHREGRTIFLSTHHLYEADVLGDRVIMIHKGKIVSSGSPLFFKTQYGSGYHLMLSKTHKNKESPRDGSLPLKGSSDSAHILEFVQRHVPSARVSEDVGTELAIVLPTDRGETGNFQHLFSDLDGHLGALGIESYGVTDTSLEEVFLKLLHQTQRNLPIEGSAVKSLEWRGLVDDRDSGVGDNESGAGSSVDSIKKQPLPSLTPTTNSRSSRLPLTTTNRVTGCGLSMYQFGALFTKRFHHYRRDPKSYVSQLLMPILFVILAMGMTLITPANDDMPSLLLTPDIYQDVKMFYRMHDETPASHSYANTMLHSPGIGTTCMANSSRSHQCTTPWEASFRTTPQIPTAQLAKYLDPAECECTEGRSVCPEGAGGLPQPHTVTAADGILYDITGTNVGSTEEYLLKTHNDFIHDRMGGWSFSPNQTTVWFNNKGWHSMPGFYNSLSNMVLRANTAHNSSHYGISTFNHPLPLTQKQLSSQALLQGIAETGIALTILCAFCFVPAGYTIYLVHERVTGEKRMQFVYGVGLGTYWFTAFIWDMLAYLLIAGLAIAIAAAFQIPTYTDRLNLAGLAVALILFGWASIPFVYLFVRRFTDTATGYMTMFVVNLLIGIVTTAAIFLMSLFRHVKEIKTAYSILSSVFLIFPQFCLGDGIIRISRNQFFADINKRFHVDSYVSPFTENMLMWHFVAMAIEGFCFLVLNFIIESRPCENTTQSEKAKCAVQSGLDGMSRKKMDPTYHEDDDVSLERQRVMTGEARDDLLVLYNLKKVFKKGKKKITAVDNVTMGIPRGECFGLLGVNGAGKTTTFHMMTGEVIPTAGAALLDGNIISENLPPNDQRVGYCPQVDALDPNLTVRETLLCNGKLKGIPTDGLKKIIPVLLHKLCLGQFETQVVKKLSGGTKRKLSTAVALLGDPDVVLMDEPTTGMDPQTRRLVWNNITDVIRDNRSVVLTSHSMEECEAMCTRLAIMVNGRFQCLGNRQHLKNKFGHGYTVMLKINQNTPYMSHIVNYMLSTFQGAKVKDHHLNLMEFEIPHSSASLADIFRSLEESRTSLGIQDYSVTQTSLDQVFVNFARKQTDGNEGESGSSAQGGTGYINPTYVTYDNSDEIAIDPEDRTSIKL